jgi:RNA polymerase sigma-54 factor
MKCGVCELVVAALDDDGYLTSHSADLAMAGRVSLEDIEKAVAIVQALEPAGVAARDLRERLLLQAGSIREEKKPLFTALSQNFSTT